MCEEILDFNRFLRGFESNLQSFCPYAKVLANKMPGEMKITGEGDGDLLSLPIDVISSILSLTTPMEAGRLSAVCPSFNAAVESDIVWNSFLPSDIFFMISLAKPNDLHFDPVSSSKKHIFVSLCNTPLLFDHGTKSFSLEKRGGKKCIMIGARCMSINIYGYSNMIWDWEYHPDSRFGDVIVLIDTSDHNRIRGRINCATLSPKTIYGAYFVFNLKKCEYTANDIFISQILGYFPRRDRLDPYMAPERPQRTPLHTPWLIFIYNCEVESQLQVQRSRIRWDIYQDDTQIELVERQDGWFEIVLGEFESGDGYETFDAEFESGDGYEIFDVEIVRGDIKRPGMELVIEGIEVRPIIL